MFSDHSGDQLEINKRKITGKYPNMPFPKKPNPTKNQTWKMKSIINSKQAKEEIIKIKNEINSENKKNRKREMKQKADSFKKKSVKLTNLWQN